MNCQASVLMTLDMVTIVPLSSFESTADTIMFLFSDGLLFHTVSVIFCYLLLTCVYAQREVLHLIFVVEITHTVSLLKC